MIQNPESLLFDKACISTILWTDTGFDYSEANPSKNLIPKLKEHNLEETIKTKLGASKEEFYPIFQVISDKTGEKLIIDAIPNSSYDWLEVPRLEINHDWNQKNKCSGEVYLNKFELDRPVIAVHLSKKSDKRRAKIMSNFCINFDEDTTFKQATYALSKASEIQEGINEAILAMIPGYYNLGNPMYSSTLSAVESRDSELFDIINDIYSETSNCPKTQDAYQLMLHEALNDDNIKKCASRETLNQVIRGHSIKPRERCYNFPFGENGLINQVTYNYMIERKPPKRIIKLLTEPNTSEYLIKLLTNDYLSRT